jgi:hypothetical protein
VEISQGAGRGGKGSEFTVLAGSAQLKGVAQPTGGDWVFREFPVGELELAAGKHKLQVKGSDITLERVVLRPL